MPMVKMFGPSISEPSKMVNRDVPECDVQAYKAAGYKEGSLPETEDPVVQEQPAEPAKEADDSNALPEGFPGLPALHEAGIFTFSELRGVEDLTEISGIGKATAEKIEDALEAEK